MLSLGGGDPTDLQTLLNLLASMSEENGYLQ